MNLRMHSVVLPTCLAAGLLGFAALGQRTAQGPFHELVAPELFSVAHPRNWVQIQGGAPYVVPPGKIFVPLAVGHPTQFMGVSIVVDNQKVVRALSAEHTSMTAIPMGLAVTAGKTITLADDSSGEGWAWGYLVDD